MAARKGRLAVANADVAARLDEVASLLSVQGANPFRVRAYQNGAEAVRALDRPLHDVLEREGPAGLEALPGIGPALAAAIEALVRTGRLAMLDRLRGEVTGPDVLATVPGVGPKLARRIHDELGIESLHALEAAAHDGRLARVPGFGARRVLAVRESLAGRFRRPRPATPDAPLEARAADAPPRDEPPIEELLDVDREYRERAERGELPRVAPRRFNPEGEAWLSILHAERGARHYTALYSNTALAHRSGATRDWVVLHRDDETDGQWTVVTARRGALAGRRVVRGREAECAAHYAREAPAEEG